MSDSDDPVISDGRRLSELKVVDLKLELDKYGLSKNGIKSVLQDRLREHLGGSSQQNGDDGVEKLENREKAVSSPESITSPNAGINAAGNSLVAEYLAKQQQALQEAKKEADEVRAAAGEQEEEDDQETSGKDDDDGDVEDNREPIPPSEQRHESPIVEPRLRSRSPSVQSDKKEEEDGAESDEEESTKEKQTSTSVETSQHSPSEAKAAELSTEKESSISPQPEERAERPQAEEVKDEERSVSPEDRQKSLSPDRREKSLSPDRREKSLSPGRRERSESPEKHERSVSPDQHVSEGKGVSPSPEPEEQKPVQIIQDEESVDIPSRDRSSEGVMDEEEVRTIDETEKPSVKPVRKRKWGKTRAGKRPTAVAISTDSLKEIIKDVSVEEASVELDFDEAPVEKPKRVVVAEMDEEEEVQNVDDDEPAPKRIVVEERVDEQIESDDKEQEPEKTFSLTEDGFERVKSPSPARYPVSPIIHIRGLTRPFTNPQLHGLLAKFGDFIKEDFWIDNIKSHCLVKYDSEENATKARERLHNVIWPTGNPKQLRVDFASQDDLDRYCNRPVKEEKQTEKENEFDTVQEERSKERRRSSPAAERSSRKASARSPRRSGDQKPFAEREWDRGKKWNVGESPPREDRRPPRRRLSRSPIRDMKTERNVNNDRPANLLDELFRKTKTTPCIYWLPLTEEQQQERMRERELRGREQKERFDRLRQLEAEEEREARRRNWYRDRQDRSSPSPPRRRR